MHRSLIAAALVATIAPRAATAHAIFPGRATVQTMGERAYVQLRAVNARKDVSTFIVEVFDGDSWTPSRIAVAWPQRLTVLPPAADSTEANDQPFSVMVALDGKPQQRLRVCTKSVPRADQLRSRIAIVNTRVCANILVKRFQP